MKKLGILIKRAFTFLFHHSAWGITMLRLTVGGLIFYQGILKAFVTGFGIPFFTQLRMPAPWLLGPAITGLELIGGLFLIIGLFVRYLGAIFTIEFLTAGAVIAAERSMMSARFEYVILAGVVILAMQGAGAMGVDRVGRPWEPFSDRRRSDHTPRSKSKRRR